MIYVNLKYLTNDAASSQIQTRDLLIAWQIL